jgi:hypothetical protein
MKYTIIALALAAFAFTACSKDAAPAPKKAATGYSK